MDSDKKAVVPHLTLVWHYPLDCSSKRRCTQELRGKGSGDHAPGLALGGS